jgi:hypothetical protein
MCVMCDSCVYVCVCVAHLCLYVCTCVCACVNVCVWVFCFLVSVRASVRVPFCAFQFCCFRCNGCVLCDIRMLQVRRVLCVLYILCAYQTVNWGIMRQEPRVREFLPMTALLLFRPQTWTNTGMQTLTCKRRNAFFEAKESILRWHLKG